MNLDTLKNSLIMRKNKSETKSELCFIIILNFLVFSRLKYLPQFHGKKKDYKTSRREKNTTWEVNF